MSEPTQARSVTLRQLVDPVCNVIDAARAYMNQNDDGEPGWGYESMRRAKVLRDALAALDRALAGTER